MSFGSIAEDYDRLRPGPPDAAVDWLLPERRQIVVDLAAGTGLLTRVLARKVEQVVAVEPDKRMGAVLRARSPGGVHREPGAEGDGAGPGQRRAGRTVS
jgi:ubiquinone/menaquinone biosynthesis C-methylase UbiE